MPSAKDPSKGPPDRSGPYDRPSKDKGKGKATDKETKDKDYTDEESDGDRHTDEESDGDRHTDSNTMYTQASGIKMPFHNRRRHLEERDMADALSTLPPLAPTLSIGIQESATPATLPRVTRQRAVTMMNAVGRLATAVKNNNTRALPTTPTGITENASAWLSRPSGSSSTSAIRSTTAGWSADLFAPGPLSASPLAPGPSCSATTATTSAACTPAIPTVLDTTHTTPANNSPPHTSNTTDDAPTDDNDNTHTTPIQGPTLTPESDATLASHAISPTLSATSAISDTSGSPDPLASSSPPVVLYDTNGLPILPQPYFNDVTWEVEDYHPIIFTLPPPAIASPITATTTTPTIATAATSSATVTALTAVPPLAIATTTGAITGVSTVAATSTAPAAQTPLAITDTTTTASTSAAGSSTLGRDRQLSSPITVPRLPFVDKSDFHSNPVPDQPTDNETPLASPASPRVVNLTVYQVEPQAPSTPDRESKRSRQPSPRTANKSSKTTEALEVGTSLGTAWMDRHRRVSSSYLSLRSNSRLSSSPRSGSIARAPEPIREVGNATTPKGKGESIRKKVLKSLTDPPTPSTGQENTRRRSGFYNAETSILGPTASRPLPSMAATATGSTSRPPSAAAGPPPPAADSLLSVSTRLLPAPVNTPCFSFTPEYVRRPTAAEPHPPIWYNAGHTRYDSLLCECIDQVAAAAPGSQPAVAFPPVFAPTDVPSHLRATSMHFGRDTTGRFVYWHAVGALFFNPAARDDPLAVLRNDRNAFQGCTSVFPHTLYPSLQPETRELEQHRYNTNSAFLKTHDLSPHRAARVTRDLPPPHNGWVSYTQANAPAAVNVAPRPENQPHLLAPEAEAAFRAQQLDSLQALHDEVGVGALNAVSLNQGRHALAQRSLSIPEEQPETVPNPQMNLQADSAEDVEGEYAPSVAVPGQALAQESESDSYASDYWNEVEEFHAILREED